MRPPAAGDGAAESRLRHRAVGVRGQQRREGFSALARRIGDDAVHVVGGEEAQEIDARAGDRRVGGERDDRHARLPRRLRDRRDFVGKDRAEDDPRAFLQAPPLTAACAPAGVPLRVVDGDLDAGVREIRSASSAALRNAVAVAAPLPPAERGSSSATRTLPVPITSPRLARGAGVAGSAPRPEPRLPKTLRLEQAERRRGSPPCPRPIAERADAKRRGRRRATDRGATRTRSFPSLGSRSTNLWRFHPAASETAAGTRVPQHGGADGEESEATRRGYRDPRPVLLRAAARARPLRRGDADRQSLRRDAPRARHARRPPTSSPARTRA